MITEIEFLVKLLSEDSMSDEMKLKLLARIAEVEQNRAIVNPFAPGLLPYISSPTIVIPVPCIHEYPNQWGATIPPSCIKCGKQMAYPYYTITSVGGSISTLATNESSNTLDFQAKTGLVGSIPSTSLKNN